MRALPGATTACRVLIGLDRAGASGALQLRAFGRSATIGLRAGQVVGANIDRRVPSSHRQLLAGVCEAYAWDDLSFRFDAGEGLASWWTLSEPLRARALALTTMRAAAKGVSHERVRTELGIGVFRLTAPGEALVDGADLGPAEQAVVSWLRRGVLAEDIVALPGCGLRGYRFAWILKLLGAAAPKKGGSYPLLLRKRREMRQQASAHALLDLPEGAGGRDARVALRKLVRHLHPDRFGEGVPAALRRASGEIVTALVDAEARIASGAAD